MRILGAVVLAGCFAQPPSPSPSSSYHKTITLLQPTPTALAEFPVSIALASDPELAAHALDGSDITFDDDAGQPLPCEIVDYSAGTLDAWVRVPMLPAQPATLAITMRYGDPRARGCVASDVWTDYVGVWHLSGSEARVERDSTSYRHDLSATTLAASPGRGAGIIGGGRMFIATGEQMCGTSPDASLQFSETASFGYEMWIDENAAVGMYDLGLNKGGGSVQQVGFDQELGSGSWRAVTSDGATLHGANLVAAPSPGIWYQATAVIDRDSAQLLTYQDGEPSDAQPMPATSLSGPDVVCLGYHSDPLSALVDEARIFTGARSADWFRAEHANVMARDTFVSIGPEAR